MLCVWAWCKRKATQPGKKKKKKNEGGTVYPLCWQVVSARVAQLTGPLWAQRGSTAKRLFVPPWLLTAIDWDLPGYCWLAGGKACLLRGVAAVGVVSAFIGGSLEGPFNWSWPVVACILNLPVDIHGLVNVTIFGRFWGRSLGFLPFHFHPQFPLFIGKYFEFELFTMSILVSLTLHYKLLWDVAVGMFCGFNVCFCCPRVLLIS